MTALDRSFDVCGAARILIASGLVAGTSIVSRRGSQAPGKAVGSLPSPGSFDHCSLRYPVLTLCLYRRLCGCRECILGSQAVSLSDHKVESKTDFPSPFGCASLSSGLSAEAKGPGRKTDFSIKATVP